MAARDSASTFATRCAAFIDGLAAPWAGLRYMWRYPKLWRYAIIPVVLNVLITVVVLGGFLAASVTLATWLHPKFSSTWSGWLAEAATFLGLAVATVGGVAAAWLLLQAILCGYFYARLACQVELLRGLKREELKDLPLADQVIEAVQKTALLIGINVGFLLLHCVPFVGSVVAICGALYCDCLFFGREFLDYPLSLRGRPAAEKREFFRQNRMQVLGLGASVLLLNFVPLLGAVLSTTAVTGAVLLHQQLALDSPRIRPGHEATVGADQQGSSSTR
jgi:uncharacterized protein involved in cysteine biosynthesis